jgi:hypothetical protein
MLEAENCSMRLPNFAFLLASLAFSGVAAADTPDRAFTGEDLFKLEAATDPQPSPDGKSVVYVRQSGDVMSDRKRRSIWKIDVASGDMGQAGAVRRGRRAAMGALG